MSNSRAVVRSIAVVATLSRRVLVFSTFRAPDVDFHNIRRVPTDEIRAMTVPSSQKAATAIALRRLGACFRGRYSILRLIGVGGMGAVYAGVHRNGHAVAIKVLHERLSSDPEIERLFRREAHLANKVGHPTVVPVIDDDITEDGCVFLVLPLLRGETLRARALRAGGRLPVHEVVVIAHTVLEGLAAAHAKRIVHRDIKPENIFVESDGAIRILDFGIGGFFSRGTDASATRSGRALGTPAFMAPEQALGKAREVDGRSDLWSVGATMFALVAGRFVHEGETPEEISVRTATRRAPTLADVAVDVPQSIADVVDRALRFNPKERWADAAAMARALLEASPSALGKPLSELPRLVVASVADDGAAPFDSLPTKAPYLRDAQLDPAPIAGARASTPRVFARRLTPAPSSARAAILRRSAAVLVVMMLASIVIARRASGPPANAVVSSTLAPQPSVDDGAMHVDLEAALQLWSDGSIDAARRRFEMIAKSQVTASAAAHLYYAAASEWVNADFRSHLGEAGALRRQLSARDAGLLQALDALAHVPPNFAETTSALARLTEEHPGDGILWKSRVGHALRARQSRSVLDLVRDFNDPYSQLARARALLQLGAVDESRAQLMACAANRSHSIDCLDWLARLDLNEGNCATAADVAKRIVASDPASPVGYGYLASAEIGRTGSTHAARAILEERWAHTPIEVRDATRFRDQYFLDVYDGHFIDARRDVDAWERAVRGVSDGSARSYPLVCRIDLELELGDRDAGAHEARRLEDSSEGWLGDDYVDLPTEVSRALYLTGAIDRASLDARRKVEQSWIEARGGYFASPGIQWFESYAQVTADSADAREAIARLPSEEPMVEAVYRDVGVDEEVGRVYLLSGHRTEAIASLTRATRSCGYLKSMQRARAYRFLGDALADSDWRASCSAYQRVLSMWGMDSRSVTTRAAVSATHKLKCP